MPDVTNAIYRTTYDTTNHQYIEDLRPIKDATGIGADENQAMGVQGCDEARQSAGPKQQREQR